jgi:hypothetical protein
VEDVEGSSLAALSSRLLSAIASIFCSFDDGTGAGTKNFVLAGRAGFTDGTEGDWNKFAELPLFLLKVSTYLNNSQIISSIFSFFQILLMINRQIKHIFPLVSGN